MKILSNVFLIIFALSIWHGLAWAGLDSGGGRAKVGTLQAHASLGSPFTTSAVTAGVIDGLYPFPQNSENTGPGGNPSSGISGGSSGGDGNAVKKSGKKSIAAKSSSKKSKAKKSAGSKKSASKSSSKKSKDSKGKKTKKSKKK
jgi:hypothetical protein